MKMMSQLKRVAAAVLAAVILLTSIAPAEVHAEDASTTVSITLQMGDGTILVNNERKSQATVSCNAIDSDLKAFWESYATTGGTVYQTVEAAKSKKFLGWSILGGNGQLCTEDAFIKECKKGQNVTLNALYQTVYKVYLNANGGKFQSGQTSQTYELDEGTKYAQAKFETPVREGYTLGGWFYKDSKETEIPVDIENGSVTQDIILFANWKGNNYKVTFMSVGQKVSEQQVTFGNLYGNIFSTPTRTGYTLDGWYDAEKGGTKVDAYSRVQTAKDHTLYARWNPIQYSITYDLRGGSIKGTLPTSYTIESGDVKIENPTRAGYVFAGWTVCKDNVTLPNNFTDYVITANTIGTYKLTANWILDVNAAQNIDAIKKSTFNNVNFSVETGDAVVTGLEKKDATSVTIPATIKVNAKVYKVTAIAPNAFKGCTSLKKVTIGKNVEKIGKNAFYGCKNLKSITIKSKNIKTIGAKAIKGINNKATIKCPKTKKTAYTKLFTEKKGFVETMKIK
jgi:uncharacterized repeat protein (TIGR02543 family)